MKKIEAIIVEDEKPIRAYLKRKLGLFWPELFIAGETDNGETALNLINEFQPDVVFLDIRIPKLSGIEVAQKISGKCLIVFITAYEKYAVDAFENGAIDYILKPTTDDRLKKTIERLKNHLINSEQSFLDMSETLKKVLPSLQEFHKYLQWIKVDYKEEVRLIPISDVYYFKATDKYTTVRTKENEYLIRKTIKELIDGLNPNEFWRIHRATIVNVRTILNAERSFTGKYIVKFKDIKDYLIVSRTYSHLFKHM